MAAAGSSGVAGRGGKAFRAGVGLLWRLPAGGNGLLSRFTGGSLVENGVFLLLLAVGAAVRLALLGDIPHGLHIDEASTGYEAWALSEYGIDRHGYRYPVNLVAWGGGQSALYSYLAAPFTKLMGLSVLSVRLPMALLGLAVLPALYDIGRSLRGRRCGLVFLFAGAICPWHIMLSRWGLESNLFPMLALFGFALLLRGLRGASSSSSLSSSSSSSLTSSTSWLLLPALALLSLCLYAYATAYFFVPLFMVGVLAYGIRRGLAAGNRFDGLRWAIALAAMAVVAIPIVWFLLTNLLDWSAVTTPLFSIPKYSGIPRYTTKFLLFSPDIIAQLLTNGELLLEILVKGQDRLVFANYDAIPGYGWFYRGGFVLSLFGAVWMAWDLVKRPGAAPNWLALLWLAAALLTALLITPPIIHRVNIVFFPLVSVAAYGLFRLCTATPAYRWQRRLLRGGAIVVTAYLALSFAAFTAAYFGEYQPHPIKFKPLSYAEAFQHITEYAPERETVYLTETVLYIIPLFYSRTDPYTYLDTVDFATQAAELQPVRAFGKYRFGIDAAARRNGSAFLATRWETAGFAPHQFSVFNFGEYSAIYRQPQNRERITLEVYLDQQGDAELRRILDAAPAARAAESDFSIYHDRDRNRLIYVQKPCVLSDLDAPFFLHLYPSNAAELPEQRQQYGFDNWDFRFAEQTGNVLGDGCIVVRELPDYDISSVRTGQYRPGEPRRLWEIEFSLRGE